MNQPFTSLYTHNRQRSKDFATEIVGESMTQQSDADECDINVIMKKYGPGGQLPQVIGKPLYGDFSEALEYRDAVEMIRAADEAFQEIPAKIRARFNNDPQEFIEWATDPENLDEVRKAGLAPPAPVLQSAPGAGPGAQPAPATSAPSTPSAPQTPPQSPPGAA